MEQNFELSKHRFQQTTLSKGEAKLIVSLSKAPTQQTSQ